MAPKGDGFKWLYKMDTQARNAKHGQSTETLGHDFIGNGGSASVFMEMRGQLSID